MIDIDATTQFFGVTTEFSVWKKRMDDSIHEYGAPSDHFTIITSIEDIIHDDLSYMLAPVCLHEGKAILAISLEVENDELGRELKKFRFLFQIRKELTGKTVIRGVLDDRQN